jgi:hypothetical protein
LLGDLRITVFCGVFAEPFEKVSSGESAGVELDALRLSWNARDVAIEPPSNWWTPLLSSGGSGKVSNEPGTASFYG